MRKLPLIGLALLITLFGCGKPMADETYETIKKQVVGAVILDVFEVYANATWGEAPGDTVVPEADDLDSLTEIKIGEITAEHGFDADAFYKKGKVLEEDPLADISAAVEEEITLMFEKLVAGAITIGFGNLGESEEVLDRMMEGFLWTKVDELCRNKGYLPNDFADRMKGFHWPEGAPPR